MKVEIQELSNYERKLNVSIPQEVVREETDKSVAEFRKNTDIKGFRKGKIPRELVLTMFRKDVNRMVETNLLKEYLPKVLEDEKLQPVSIPEIVEQVLDNDENFTFSATFEVKPVIELGDYSSFSLTKEAVIIEEDEVETELRKLQEMRSILHEVPEERPTTAGDFLHVDLSLSLDGITLEKYSSKDQVLELGKDLFVPGLDTFLTGLIKGEERTFTLNVPDTFFDKGIAGKSIEGNARLLTIKTKEIPALDDEFARSLGDIESLAELREKITATLHQSKETAVQQKLGDQIVETLLSRNDFGVPKSLVDYQLRKMIKDTLMRYQFGGFSKEPSLEDLRKLESEYHDQAVTAVKSMLILDTIAEKEKVEVGDDEIDERITKSYQEHPALKREILNHYSKDENREMLKHQLTLDKTLLWLVERATGKTAAEQPAAE
ncbi:MAG: trigger factor [Deltaproteobacteria bacterium RIFOXYA12_FULL_61_11]|nr:MAG: trigger factor [Deltaproteobacteria bacterium RIFOXYA12_FULL_61_11]